MLLLNISAKEVEGNWHRRFPEMIIEIMKAQWTYMIRVVKRYLVIS